MVDVVGENNISFAKNFKTIQKKYLERLGHILSRETRNRFKNSVSPDNQKWLPVSDLGLALRKFRHKKKSVNPKPLLDTGRLRSSINYEVKSDTVIVGTNVEYAKLHQEGGQTKVFRNLTITVPKRQYLGISKQDEKLIDVLVDDMVDEILS